MALLVETGAGVADADSFISLVDARILAANYGLNLDVDDTAAEVQLRQGYLGLLNSERLLQGSRTFDIQTGIFPRINVYSNCVLVDSETIPSAVILSQLYYSDSINSGTETNSSNDGQNLSGFNVQGVYSETYQDGSSKRLNDTIQGVNNSLYPFTKAGFNSSPCGSGGGAHRNEYGQGWI